MNLKVHVKDVQSAQGMVEFALVLPILLLVILGVFAFGHLFFVYSSVVSASREAARWGAAVGVAPSGSPRYQDCASIRAAAVRVGAFAGVDPNIVEIEYDDGPTTMPDANCPLVGPGPDPSLIERGDRIVVRITVQYTPIVPLVNLPSFPITAETARTIVKSVPIGDAPVAEDPCITIVTFDPLIANPPSPSVTGEPVEFSVTLTAADGTTPTGEVNYSDSDGNIMGPIPLSAGGAVFPALAFQSAGDKTIRVDYVPDNTCHLASALADVPYTVNPAPTTLTITDPNNPSMVGNEVLFDIQLAVTPPGDVTTSGPVGEALTISAPGGSCEPLSAALTSICRFTPTEVNPALSVTVSYPGSAHYLPSSAEQIHTVNRLGVTMTINPNTSPIDLGETVTFFIQVTVPTGGASVEGEQVAVQSSDGSCTVTLNSANAGSCSFTPGSAHNSLGVTAYYPGNAEYDPTSASTSIRVETSNCPTTGSMSFATSGALQFQVRNTSPGNVNLTLSSVRVTWPNNEDNTTNLTSVRFGGNLNSCVTTGGQSGRNCVWTGNLPPPAQTLSSGGPSNWRGFGLALNAGVSKDMRVVFSYALPVGNYSVDLTFGSACTVTVTGSR